MIADLSIIPISTGASTSGALADVLRVVEASGIRYQLAPTTTCLEGSWEEITAVARECHVAARKHSAHVVTMLRIEDDAGETGKLQRNIEAVEEQAGQEFVKSADDAAVVSVLRAVDERHAGSAGRKSGGVAGGA